MQSSILVLKSTLFAALLVFFGASNAAYIDFTSSDWADANFKPTYSNMNDGIGVTAYANPTGAKLFYAGDDGLGVRYDYEVDEIEGDESLLIVFNRTVRLKQIDLTDLFIESRNGNTYEEFGWFSVNGSNEKNTFYADQTGSNGVHSVSGLNLLVDTLSFTAPGKIYDPFRQDHEYSLAGLEVSAVPLPAAFWLFSTALVGLVTVSRRREDR